MSDQADIDESNYEADLDEQSCRRKWTPAEPTGKDVNNGH